MMKLDLSSPVLDRISHRPYAPPSEPWVGHMRWCDLAFLHWAIDPAQVRPLLPQGLELDTFDGNAWIGVVPFRMEDVRLRFSPNIPGTSAFPELNVRTYARVGKRTGVWFFSLDAGNPVAVRGARLMFNLPYYDAEMSVTLQGQALDYSSKRVHIDVPPAEFGGSYAPAGDVREAKPGTLEYFLVERYCLFTESATGELGYLDVHHHPWPLQPATVRIDVNTMAEAAGIRLPDEPPLAHFARDLEVLAWNRHSL
jgi:uncharacterized protein YqjF (DUF2071 family)